MRAVTNAREGTIPQLPDLVLVLNGTRSLTSTVVVLKDPEMHQPQPQAGQCVLAKRTFRAPRSSMLQFKNAALSASVHTSTHLFAHTHTSCLCCTALPPSAYLCWQLQTALICPSVQHDTCWLLCQGTSSCPWRLHWLSPATHRVQC